ncbi:type VII toxin-antitoxin system HepT family RNase toxin [Vulcanisaeta sp. JCM 16161]|uniref:type VII toxin-antitoxin system HepT family RNase toxin n=1 Tax=Vulcanisaeta sp. JCM 16161 TaxID=1295372 RepID=UPI00406CAADF
MSCVGRLSDLLAIIKRNVDEVDALVSRYGVNELINDYVLLNATLHMLQIAIKALIDMGSHIMVEKGLKAPSTYSEVPIYLGQVSIISDDDSRVFRRMIGFRNVLVHNYSQVSIDVLREILAKALYRDLLRIALRLYDYAVSNNIDV